MSLASMKDKVIAITGGAGGIGLSLAKLLASEKAILSLADSQQEPLEAAGAALAAQGVKVMVTVVDVRDSAAVDQWIEDTVKAFGRVDGAANLAGILRGATTIADMSDELFESVMSVNVNGVMKCLRAEIRAMQKGGGGSIVNAGSVAGLVGASYYGAYIASKHAVLGLTRTAAKETAQGNIRVNAVCPGFVNTSMVTNHEGETGRKFPANNPQGRLAEPDEVAKMIRFLLSDDSSHTTGASVTVDGGWMA